MKASVLSLSICALLTNGMAAWGQSSPVPDIHVTDLVGDAADPEQHFVIAPPPPGEAYARPKVIPSVPDVALNVPQQELEDSDADIWCFWSGNFQEMAVTKLLPTGYYGMDHNYPLLAKRYADGGYYLTARCIAEEMPSDPAAHALLIDLRARHLGDEFVSEHDPTKKKDMLRAEQDRRIAALASIQPLSRDEANREVYGALGLLFGAALLGAANDAVIHAGDPPKYHYGCVRGPNGCVRVKIDDSDE